MISPKKGFFSPKNCKTSQILTRKRFPFSPKNKIPKKEENFCPQKKSLGFCKNYNFY